jgi:peptide methionine sulfoxide reductase MsrA
MWLKTTTGSGGFPPDIDIVQDVEAVLQFFVPENHHKRYIRVSQNRYVVENHHKNRLGLY